MNTSSTPFIVNGELDLGAVLTHLFRARRTIFLIVGIFVALCIVYLLFAQSEYQSTASVYAIGEAQPGGALGALTLPMGLLSGGGSDLHVPDIIRSNKLRREIIAKRWAVEGLPDSVSLMQYWEIDPMRIKWYNPISWLKAIGVLPRMPESMIQYAQQVMADKELEERIVVEEETSGLISVSVWMEDPQLAADIALYLTNALQKAILSTRASQARSKRLFIEDRLADVKQALVLAENAVASFRENNQVMASSPNLQMTLERLLREVEIQTQIYITLQQEYESTRIGELNTTPPLVLVNDPIRPLEPARPAKLIFLFISVFLGFTVGPVFVIVRTLVQAQSDSDLLP
jgi:uncharacterized protein involved in exopolysaccharide biosynthesis